MVWLKVPKLFFVRLDTMKLAFLSCNDGHSSKLAVYDKLGLNLSGRSVRVLLGMDMTRLKKAAETITLDRSSTWF